MILVPDDAPMTSLTLPSESVMMAGVEELSGRFFGLGKLLGLGETP